MVRIMCSAHLSPFYSKIACLCQSIRIYNNRRVCRQKLVRKQTRGGAKCAEWSLMLGTGCWVQAISPILNTSVVFSVGIQSAGDSVPETLVHILHSAKEVNFSHIYPKITCLCWIIGTDNNNMYITRARCKSQPAVGVKWAECSLTIETGYWVHVFNLILDDLVGMSVGNQSPWDSVT